MDVAPTPTQGHSQRPWLLRIPLELRQQVYDYVFHDQPINRGPCDVVHDRLGNTGCHCGEGLSCTSAQLYEETRPRFFKSARFVFKSAEACLFYVCRVGAIAAKIGSLEIACPDAYFHRSFRTLFPTFISGSSLRSLHLKFEAMQDVASPDSLPIYLPSSRRAFPGAYYDLSLRPILHPLAEINSLRSLIIEGHPMSSEIEEAIVKLSLKIEERGLAEGKIVRVFEERARGLCDYGIEIDDINPWFPEYD